MNINTYNVSSTTKQKEQIDNICSIRISTLISEWAMMENSIRNYDTIFNAIRGFSITIVLGTIAISDKIGVLNSMFVAVFTPFLFGIVELYFQTIQRQFIDRARDIERYMSGRFEQDYASGNITMGSPGIGRHFESMNMLSKRNGLLKTAKYSSGYIVHVAILAIVAAFFIPKHFFKSDTETASIAAKSVETQCNSLESSLATGTITIADFLAVGCSNERARAITVKKTAPSLSIDPAPLQCRPN